MAGTALVTWLITMFCTGAALTPLGTPADAAPQGTFLHAHMHAKFVRQKERRAAHWHRQTPARTTHSSESGKSWHAQRGFHRQAMRRTLRGSASRVAMRHSGTRLH